MPALRPAIAIIGGTGLTRFDDLDITHREVMHTPFGEPSAPITHGRVAGVDVAFLPRHGQGHTIPPHLINYQANIYALRMMGVARVVAINAVGAIDPELDVPDLVCPDQLIDYTFGRAHTFESTQRRSVRHIDFGEPYDPVLRSALVTAARETGVPMRETAVMGVTQGPRLETAAEIRRLARDGCQIVSMTGMPETALAREIGLEYASCAVTVNFAAGIGTRPPDQELAEQLGPAMSLVHRLLKGLIPVLGRQS